MTHGSGDATLGTHELKELQRRIAGAPDTDVVRIVAVVDALTSRGPADTLISPLRQRLATLRPPRPLRFGRLLFHPLDPLIMPAAQWRQNRNYIPRAALGSIAQHIRCVMGSEAVAIEAQFINRTTADLDLIAHCGACVWPAAARILSGAEVPPTWDRSGIAPARYAALAARLAALLDQADRLETLAAATANGLLAPEKQRIDAILSGIVAAHPPALPMMMSILLTRIPEAASALSGFSAGPGPAALRAAFDAAADLLIRRVDCEDGSFSGIGSGSLSDAGASAGWVAALLEQLDTGPSNPRRRTRLRGIRTKLNARFTARFADGLAQDLMRPLKDPVSGSIAAPGAIAALEAAARGLRILETEARALGGGTTYDTLLADAAKVVGDPAMSDWLAKVDRIRLVEILAGPRAALALLA